jgi:hypothetical protein
MSRRALSAIFLQLLGHLLELLEVLSRFGAQQALHVRRPEPFELLETAGASQLALQLVHPLHLFHDAHGLGQRHILVAAERVALGHLVEGK